MKKISRIIRFVLALSSMRATLFAFFLFAPTVTYAQTAYLALTSEPCYAINEPVAKFVFKASMSAQKVLYTAENYSTKEINSFAESNCTVVDKDNWNCEKSFSTNGTAYRKDKDGDAYHYCHFSKKTFGGWELLKTRDESQSEAKQYALIKRVERLLIASLEAEIFKNGICSNSVKTYNPSFHAKAHFAENGNWIKTKYRSNKELLEFLTTDSLAAFARQNVVAVDKSIAVELGPQPTPTQCGVLNGKIDKKISIAKSEL